MREFRNTEKQSQIIRALIRLSHAGRPVTLEDLKTATEHGRKISPQALRCSLKYLTEHGFVTSERPGLFRFYMPTKKAEDLFPD
jgi:DNA-binding IscR family transcriptional regulator